MGFACLADDTRVYRSSASRGDLRLGHTITETIINEGGQHQSKIYKHMIRLSHDVYGTGLWQIPFN